jgi:hypothetical protein
MRNPFDEYDGDNDTSGVVRRAPFTPTGGRTTGWMPESAAAPWSAQAQGQSSPWSAQAQGQSGSGWGDLFSDPTTQPLMQSWQQRMNQLNVPAPKMSDIASRVYGKGGEFEYFSNATKNRIGELQQEPFSAGEEAALKAKYLDGIVRERDTARQQMRERLGSMGHSPTDGAMAQADLDVERSFGQNYGRALGDMTIYQSQERQRRRDQAQQLAALLQSTGMSAGQMVAGLRQQEWGNNQALGRERLQTSALPSELARERMAMLSQLLNGQGMDPSSIMNGLQGIGNQYAGQAQQGAQNNAAMLQAIGNVLGTIASHPQGGGVLDDGQRWEV